MTKEQLSFIDSVTILLFDYGIYGEVAAWIACQMALESKFGKSNIAKSKKNFCGMRAPHMRITTSCVTSGNDFAMYRNMRACITDYVLWLQFNGFTQYIIHDLDRFIKRLESSNYCGDAGYIASINKLFNSLKS